MLTKLIAVVKRIAMLPKEIFIEVSPDPVRHCEVYRKKGCNHVDGFLCHVPSCDILDKYRKEETKKKVIYLDQVKTNRRDV